MSPVNLCRILLVFCLVTPACIKVGPDFTKPQATIVKDWLDAGDRRGKKRTPA